jgi:hypothetical protein
VRDASVDDLIRKTLSANVRESLEPCANENLMAAYLEASLTPQEMTEFESHVSNCAACREVLALSMKMEPKSVAESPAAVAGSRKTLFRFSIPVPVLGALILAVILIPVIIRMINSPKERATPTQIAEVRFPAQTKVAAANKRIDEPKKAPELTMSRFAREERELAKPVGINNSQAGYNAGKLPASADVVLNGFVDKQALAGKEELVSKLDGLYRQKALSVPASASPPIQAKEKTAGFGEIQKKDDYSDKRELPAVLPAPVEAMNALIPNQSNSSFFRADSSAMAMRTRAEKEGAEFKKIGDKEFYLSSGIWIDRQCARRLDATPIELQQTAAEYESILKQYPEIRKLLPAVICQGDKIYKLR